jgi:hypothetical protein
LHVNNETIEHGIHEGSSFSVGGRCTYFYYILFSPCSQWCSPKVFPKAPGFYPMQKFKFSPSHLYRWVLIGTHYIETNFYFGEPPKFQCFFFFKIKNWRANESGSLPKIIEIIIGRHSENKGPRTRQWPSLASHFENVPHPWAFSYCKARGKIYHEPNLCRSQGVWMGGILCEGFMPTYRSKNPPTIEE